MFRDEREEKPTAKGFARGVTIFGQKAFENQDHTQAVFGRSIRQQNVEHKCVSFFFAFLQFKILYIYQGIGVSPQFHVS